MDPITPQALPAVMVSPAEAALQAPSIPKGVFLLDPNGQVRSVTDGAGNEIPWALGRWSKDAIIQTAADGSFTWTFHTPFPAGVTPSIQLTVQSADAGVSFSHVITAVSNTAVSGRIVRVADITILSTIHVLGIQAAAITTVHLRAIAPLDP